MSRPHLFYRDDFGSWLNELGLMGDGVEVGVASGAFSRIILEKWRGRMYHMVDFWAKQPEEVYREATNKDAPFDLWKWQATEVAGHYSRVMIWNMLSVDASEGFKDDSLDWVYIDANHSFEAVTADMNAWWPKIKSGGVMAGHDYCDNTVPPNYCQVRTAVNDWCEENKLPWGLPQLTQDAVPSWFVFKP